MIVNVMNLHQVQMKEILGRDFFVIIDFYGFIYLIMKFRSESPVSQRSSPPISPGCEEQAAMHHHLHHLSDPFKKPLPPQMHHQGFPQFYGYSPHIFGPGSSAFHRVDMQTGKPIQVILKIKKTN